MPPSNHEWMDAKSKNFLTWILATMAKYNDKGLIDEKGCENIETKLNSLLESPTQRGTVFAPLVRMQAIERIPLFKNFVKVSIEYFEKDTVHRLKTFDECIEYLCQLQNCLSQFISYLRTNQEETMEDMEKLAGYITIFFGDFVSREQV